MLVKLAYYSPSSGRGWKGHQIESMVKTLQANNSFDSFIGINDGNRPLENCREFRLPLKINNLIKKISYKIPIPGYLGYLFGEYIYGFMASFFLKGDYDVIVCKPRPFSIIKKAKENGKIVVLDYGEVHPLDMKEKVEREYSRYNINSNYIYTSEYATQESLKSIELADLIVVNSEYSKRTFLNFGVAEDKLTVLNLTSEKYSSYVTGKSNYKKLVFITTANHSMVKGTHKLIEAWADLGLNDCELLVVGQLHQDIQEYLKSIDIPKNIKFLGQQNIEELYKDKKAVGVLFSFAEGYPRVIEEYIKYGFPVICTEASTCDLIVNNENGYVVKVGDTEMLKSSIQAFFSDKDIYDRFSENMISVIKELNNTSNSGYAYNLCNLIKERFDVSKY